MFEESLMESSAHSPARRGWSILMAFGLQISALSAFLLFQALHPAALPTVFRIHEIASQISSPPPQASSQAAHASSGNSQFVDPGRTFIQPSSIPPHAYPGAAVGPSAMEALDSICHGTCGASLGVSGGTGDGSMPILQQAKNPVVISHLDEGQIISRVQPVYPVMAKATHTEGTVLLHAIIGRDGRIENLRVVSGHALLNQAALEAVGQWKFRPYILNGSPIEVETQIMVNFRLSQ